MLSFRLVPSERMKFIEMDSWPVPMGHTVFLSSDSGLEETAGLSRQSLYTYTPIIHKKLIIQAILEGKTLKIINKDDLKTIAPNRQKDAIEHIYPLSLNAEQHETFLKLSASLTAKDLEDYCFVAHDIYSDTFEKLTEPKQCKSLIGARHLFYKVTRQDFDSLNKIYLNESVINPQQVNVEVKAEASAGNFPSSQLSKITEPLMIANSPDSDPSEKKIVSTGTWCCCFKKPNTKMKPVSLDAKPNNVSNVKSTNKVNNTNNLNITNSTASNTTNLPKTELYYRILR